MMMDIFRIDTDGNSYYIAASNMNEALEVLINEVSLEENYDLTTHQLYPDEATKYLLSLDNQVGKRLFKKMSDERNYKPFMIEEDGDLVFDVEEDNGAMTGAEIAKAVEEETKEDIAYQLRSIKDSLKELTNILNLHIAEDCDNSGKSEENMNLTEFERSF